MERSGGRSPEERRAAAEARARMRRGEPSETGPAGDEHRAPLSRMSRYGGGASVYGRRRLIAGVCILIAAFVMFAMLGGC